MFQGSPIPPPIGYAADDLATLKLGQTHLNLGLNAGGVECCPEEGHQGVQAAEAGDQYRPEEG